MICGTVLMSMRRFNIESIYVPVAKQISPPSTFVHTANLHHKRHNARHSFNWPSIETSEWHISMYFFILQSQLSRADPMLNLRADENSDILPPRDQQPP